MKAIVTLLILTFALGCENKDDLKREIASYTVYRDNLQGQISALQLKLDQTTARIATLNSDETVLAAEKAGKTVRYVLELSIRQIHYSLSIKKQISDALNEEKFSIYTDRTTYEAAQPGTDLFESFRTGSAIMKGSLGTWRIKIVSKKIETP